MKTLFDTSINEEIIGRIRKLTPASKPKWGKLKVEQMLAHLDLSLSVNFGDIELKRGILGKFFKRIAHRILLGEKPFPKYLPTDKKLLAKGETDFFEEKQKVVNRVKMYVEKGTEGISKNAHNILGQITAEESAFISYKHMDHHLRQFDV